MRLGWYQSRLFWLGLVFLLVLLGAWIGFLRTSTNLAWTNGRFHRGFAWGEGSFEVFTHEQLTSYGSMFRPLDAKAEKGFRYESIPLEADKIKWFPPAFGSFHYGIPGKSDVARFYSVGQWVVVLAVFVLWIGAVIWNQRRKRKWIRDQSRYNNLPDGGIQIDGSE